MDTEEKISTIEDYEKSKFAEEARLAAIKTISEEAFSLNRASLVYRMMLEKDKDTPSFDDIEAAYHSGAYYGRGQINVKYERLLFLIDMINHGALTQDEHKLLDNILEYAHVKEDDLRRIRNTYTDYNFPTTQDQ